MYGYHNLFCENLVVYVARCSWPAVHQEISGLYFFMHTNVCSQNALHRASQNALHLGFLEWRVSGIIARISTQNKSA